MSHCFSNQKWMDGVNIKTLCSLPNHTDPSRLGNDLPNHQRRLLVGLAPHLTNWLIFPADPIDD